MEWEVVTHQAFLNLNESKTLKLVLPQVTFTMIITASWSGGWIETRLKVGAEDGIVGDDADMDLLKKVELKWRRKIHLLKNQKVPFSPMPRELHVPMQTRRRDHCYKWQLYGNLYWNKMTTTRKGNAAIKNVWRTEGVTASLLCGLWRVIVNVPLLIPPSHTCTIQYPPKLRKIKPIK